MRKSSGFQIKFDKEYLESLTQDPKSGVFKEYYKYHIALHPAQFNNFEQSIKDELGRKIAKYDQTFKGILLGFQNIKLHSDLGVIGLDNCHIHMDIQADFYVFKPEIDMELKGIIMRVTRDHVGCLVYNTFNVSLPKLENNDEDWLGKNAKVGSEVDFRITFVDFESKLLYIRGHILAVSNSKNVKGSMKNKKLNKKIIFNQDEAEEIESPGKKSSKKHKKIREKNTEIESREIKGELECEETEEDLVPKKKKKKKKKEISLEELNLIDLFADNAPDLNKSYNKADNRGKQRKTKEVYLDRENSHKKKKKHKHANNDNEEINEKDMRRKKEKRRERKQKLSEENEDISLEELNLKDLFANNSVDVNNSSKSHSMANSEDRGKRRKSNSVSTEIYLDNVKLEPDSDMERILGGTKRKKASKSIYSE